jgi:hypothetical protein
MFALGFLKWHLPLAAARTSLPVQHVRKKPIAVRQSFRFQGIADKAGLAGQSETLAGNCTDGF